MPTVEIANSPGCNVSDAQTTVKSQIIVVTLLEVMLALVHSGYWLPPWEPAAVWTPLQGAKQQAVRVEGEGEGGDTQRVIMKEEVCS